MGVALWLGFASVRSRSAFESQPMPAQNSRSKCSMIWHFCSIPDHFSSQIREERRQKSSERRSLSLRTDAEGRMQVEGEEEEEEEKKKERRRPRPIHNYVFPRPASPPHVPHSPTRPTTRMRVSLA